MKAVDKAVRLLSDLIEIPSLSRQEVQVADHLESQLSQWPVEVKRLQNNLILQPTEIDSTKVHVLLCSHIDTVKPNSGYTRNPYHAELSEGKLFGLGANDAGGSLVGLMMAFEQLIGENLPFNLWMAIVAEEEVSGANGAALVVQHLPEMQLAIVGEPTSMKLAIAEKGLMVVDGYSTGIPGHAAHANTLNPIYTAAQDILKLKEISFDRVSKLLGSTRLTVSQINAGTQHNQVPAECQFVIDVRVNELYTNEEILDILQTNTISLLKARSFRLRSSGLPEAHPMRDLATKLNLPVYGSATLSDQALLPYPSVKIGPGDTKRSHTADEFIYLSELEAGIDGYLEIIRNYNPGI